MTSSSEIYIQATETDPAVRSAAAVQRVHERLLDRLADPAVPAAALADEVRRHLAAADAALYAPAAGAAETRLLVRALRTAGAALADLAEVPGRAGAALGVHFAVERDVLLPALGALPGVDLAALVADLETLLAGGSLDRPDVIDVREIPHGQRHPRIFARWARLAPGDGFTLVNNHDPKPLRREFEATHPGAFTWDHVESGPEQWRVRIGRVAVDV